MTHNLVVIYQRFIGLTASIFRAEKHSCLRNVCKLSLYQTTRCHTFNVMVLFTVTTLEKSNFKTYFNRKFFNLFFFIFMRRATSTDVHIYCTVFSKSRYCQNDEYYRRFGWNCSGGNCSSTARHQKRSCSEFTKLVTWDLNTQIMHVPGLETSVCDHA
jgi:hypothetical protein